MTPSLVSEAKVIHQQKPDITYITIHWHNAIVRQNPSVAFIIFAFNYFLL